MAERTYSAAARKKLAPRRNPYYMAIPDIEGAYIGFRKEVRFQCGGRAIGANKHSEPGGLLRGTD